MSTISNFLPAPPDGFSTTLSASIANNSLSIPLNSVSGLGTEGVGQLFKKDSNGNVVAGSIEYVHWTNVSGNTLTLSDTGDRGLTGSSSGAQAYSAGDYFEVWVSGQYYYKKERDGFLVEHNQAGDHSTVLVTGRTAKATPVDADTFVFWDSVGNALAKLTLANLKTVLKSWILGDSDFTSPPIQRQGIINGGMQLSQELGLNIGTATFVNNTAKYLCDLFSVTLSGTAVSAGTGSQISNSTIGASGFAFKLSGVTITGAGTIKKRYRMESADAIKYKNKVASFSMLELQDTGGSLNYTIQINKANAADNFAGGVTQIAISGNLAVPSATGTLIKLENVSMGDCSNGIEIVVTIPCGAITTKNFETTEWQMNVGAVVLPFACASIAEELEKMKRYLVRFGGEVAYEFLPIGLCNTTTNIQVIFPSKFRVIPVLLIGTTWQTTSGIACTGYAIDATFSSSKNVVINFTTSGQTVGAVMGIRAANSLLAYLLLDARFTA